MPGLGSKLRILRGVAMVFGLLVFLIALWALHGALKEYHFRQIMTEFSRVSAARVIMAACLALLSYLVMGGYDALALRYVGRPQTLPRSSLVAFLAYAFGNNLGIANLGTSTIRYRFYSAWGYSGLDISRIIAFCGITFWLGYLLLGGTLFLFDPPRLDSSLNLPGGAFWVSGSIFLALVIAYLIWVSLRHTPFRFRDMEFVLPSKKTAFMQLAVSSVDWLLAGSTLYVLMPELGIPWTQFLGIYLLAQLIAIISHVPGGLFVLESLLVHYLASDAFPASQVVGCLLVFRVIYYLAPLMAAVLLLSLYEGFHRRTWLRQVSRAFGSGIATVMPSFLAITTFLGGVILLFSGATPPVNSRLGWLDSILPLPVMEFSHLLGSVVGTALLFLARGLQRRLDGAYYLTALLLGSGVLLSLLKGLDYEEAFILLVMLAALLPCRREFYRKAAILSDRFSLGLDTGHRAGLERYGVAGLFLL